MTTTTLARAGSVYAAGLQVREITAPAPLSVREDDAEDAREVSGIAVPYGQRTELWSFDGTTITEEFAPGACEPRNGRTLLYYLHRTPIGKVTKAEHTDAGWEISGPVSRTATGDEALTLARDEVIERMSVGFHPVEWTEDRDDDGNVHITITRAEVAEVSLVPFPAYEGAEVTGTRSATTTPPHGITPPHRKETPMPEDNTTLETVREDVADLTRRFSVFAAEHPGTPAAPVAQFRSVGQLVKALAAGDDAAIREYEGATTADAITKDGWIGSLVEIIKKRRTVLSEFATGALPAEGMGVEYAELESDTTDVGVQAAQGDDLDFGKVKIVPKVGPVATLGGWSSLSRQAIERASVGILDTTWEAMAEKYGQASEAYARAILTTAYNAAGGDALATVEADLTTQDGVVAGILDLAEHFDNAGRALDGVFLDKASFLALYAVEANPRILQVSGAPLDKVGTIDVQTAQGDVAGLTFKLLPNAAAGTVLAYDRTAIKSLESPGAPFRLQDDNIVNLTKDFSLYGYLASFVQKRAGLVKVTASAG